VKRGLTSPGKQSERYGWLIGPLFGAAGLVTLWITHAPWTAVAAFLTVDIGWTLMAWNHEIKQRRRELDAQEVEKTLVELSHEFHTVLDQFTGCCTDQYVKGRSEINQLRSLLGDAAGRLMGGVENLRTQVEAQQATLERLALRAALVDDPLTPIPFTATLQDLLPEGVSDLAEVKAALDATLSSTTTALQFEDLTSQLAGHIDDRLEYLQALHDGISAIDTQLQTPPANALTMRAFYQERLAHMQRGLNAAAVLIEHAEHVAVQQERLEVGEVELF